MICGEGGEAKLERQSRGVNSEGGGRGGSGVGGWGEDRHGILLRDTLMLSRLLIKALICLAEGRKAGICGDIISRLKAMPSWS